MIGMVLLVRRLHAGHGDDPSGPQADPWPAEGVKVPEFTSPMFSQNSWASFRIVGHVDAGRRPGDAVGRPVELDQTAQLRRTFGEGLYAAPCCRG